MKTQVYRNLHRRCLSLRQCGKVVGYVDQITLTGARFYVSQASRARLRRRGACALCGAGRRLGARAL